MDKMLFINLLNEAKKKVNPFRVKFDGKHCFYGTIANHSGEPYKVGDVLCFEKYTHGARAAMVVVANMIKHDRIRKVGDILRQWPSAAGYEEEIDVARFCSMLGEDEDTEIEVEDAVQFCSFMQTLYYYETGDTIRRGVLGFVHQALMCGYSEPYVKPSNNEIA